MSRAPRALHPRDITRVAGIPATTAARALLEIAAQLSDRRLRRAVRQAQAEGSTSVRQIADVLRRANGHRATKRQADLEVAGERVLGTTAAQAIVEPRRLVRRLALAGAPYTDRQQ